MSREFAIVVFGATGFTGKLVCKHLSANYGPKQTPKLKWAIAGRSQSKMDETLKSLGLSDIPTIVVDAHDAAGLAKVVARTDVVLTTVGPYTLYGKEVVAACAKAGTDYCDLTGEANFVADMVTAHDATAKSTGARIVHCCGFDSIPFDIGVLCLSYHLGRGLPKASFPATAASAPAKLSKVESTVIKMKGGISGGTLASMSAIMSLNKSVLKKLSNPYYVAAAAGGPSRGVDRRDTVTRPTWNAYLRSWTAPFVMASINSKIIRWTSTLLGLYGDTAAMSYRETVATGRGFSGFIGALVPTLALPAFVIALMVAPIRWLLYKFVLPAPGQGPDEKTLQSGFCVVRTFGTSTEGKSGAVEFRCGRDPGYADTSVMLAESAMLLHLTRKNNPSGGVMSPAAALGLNLRSRLEQFNITWSPVEEKVSS